MLRSISEIVSCRYRNNIGIQSICIHYRNSLSIKKQIVRFRPLNLKLASFSSSVFYKNKIIDEKEPINGDNNSISKSLPVPPPSINHSDEKKTWQQLNTVPANSVDAQKQAATQDTSQKVEINETTNTLNSAPYNNSNKSSSGQENKYSSISSKDIFKSSQEETNVNATSSNSSDTKAQEPRKDTNMKTGQPLMFERSSNKDLKENEFSKDRTNATTKKEKSSQTDYTTAFNAMPLGPSKQYKSVIQMTGLTFTKEGNCIIQEGEFKKSDLCIKYTMQPRDLRKLDSSMENTLPSLLVREKSIIMNLGHIRAVIQADNVFILNVHPEDHAFQSMLIHELEGKLGSKDLPFELKAVEAILLNVVAKLEMEQEALLPKIKSFLISLNDYVNQEKLKEMLMHRREISTFQRKVDAIRAAIDEILNNDEDLAGMYVTDKEQGTGRPVSQHMEAELLLEHYSKLIDEICDRVAAVSDDMSATEAIIHIVLDKQRNNLILFDLKANLAAVSLATGTFITSIFGMNLSSSLETLPGLFYITCVASALLTLVVYRAFMRSLGMIRPGKLNTAEEIQKLLKK